MKRSVSSLGQHSLKQHESTVQKSKESSEVLQQQLDILEEEMHTKQEASLHDLKIHNEQLELKLQVMQQQLETQQLWFQDTATQLMTQLQDCKHNTVLYSTKCREDSLAYQNYISEFIKEQEAALVQHQLEHEERMKETEKYNKEQEDMLISQMTALIHNFGAQHQRQHQLTSAISKSSHLQYMDGNTSTHIHIHHYTIHTLTQHTTHTLYTFTYTYILHTYICTYIRTHIPTIPVQALQFD